MKDDVKIILKRSVAMPGTIDTRHISSTALNDRREKNLRVLEDARICWDSLDSFRRAAERCRRYAYGDQWGDKIKDNGEYITEEEYIKRQGKVPLKNNVIRQLMKSVLGQFENVPTRPVCFARNRKEQVLGEMMTIAMECAYDSNRMDILDSRTLESYMISGFAMHKVVYTWLYEEQRHDVYVTNVSPYKMFFDGRGEDVRQRDLTMIGQLHDMSIDDVIRLFAGFDRAKAKRIREIYAGHDGSMTMNVDDTIRNNWDKDNDFFVCRDPNMCRVIEVWRRESREFLHCHDTARGETYRLDPGDAGKIEAINFNRLQEASLQGISEEDVALIETTWSVDNQWYVRFFSPYGDVLFEAEDPYWHGSHPYIMSVYPYVDRRAHSFVEDVIDQQRYINRLITMIDFIMGSSAKGVLLFPADQIPDGMTIDDIAEEWTRYNGVILFRPKPGAPIPQQISTNATNVGAYELLNLQMKLLQDISGVQSALQGQQPRSGTSGVQYAQEAMYSQNNLVNLLNSFRYFREERDRKVMRVIQQYYKDGHYMNVQGNHSDEAKQFTPEKVRNVDFTLSITESSYSPTYRAVANEMLMELFKVQAIGVKDLLENGSFPFADKLLQAIDKREREMQEMQGGDGFVPSDVQQAMEAEVNPALLSAIQGRQGVLPQLPKVASNRRPQDIRRQY